MFSIIVALASLLLLRFFYELYRDRSLPPGPRRLPFIGNVHQAPTDLPWRTFHEWSKQYGPIFSVQFGKDTLIMITDYEMAHDLLDKRGSIYSDRPRLVMAGENLTKGMHVLLRPYDEGYRKQQRMAAPHLSPRASQNYLPLQELESKQTVFDLLSTNDFPKVFNRYAASIVMSLAYGFRVPTGSEKVIDDGHRVQDNFVYAARVGTWIVDSLPALNYLPNFLAPWKRLAEEFFQFEANMHRENVKLAHSTKSSNWAKAFADSKEAQGMPHMELDYSVGVLANAGLDTTADVLRIFVLAALSHPDAVRAAQQELDEVVGPDRLPQFSDKEKLPYLVAFVEEVLRWRPLAPAGVPHATMEEDYYMGYRIPKGSVIVPVVWSMSLDGKVFDDPDGFKPERWIDNPKHRHAAFGFGRRMCAGRHIARNSLFILISRMLWAFDIKPETDENGEDIQVDDLAFESGFTSRPFPFKAVFEPRSDRTREVIRSEWYTAEKDVDTILNSIRKF